jgi:hypothetical protein
MNKKVMTVRERVKSVLSQTKIRLDANLDEAKARIAFFATRQIVRFIFTAQEREDLV